MTPTDTDPTPLVVKIQGCIALAIFLFGVAALFSYLSDIPHGLYITAWLIIQMSIGAIATTRRRYVLGTVVLGLVFLAGILPIFDPELTASLLTR
jgi:hypothetical protein